MSNSKAITIRFKLHGQAADLARALHDHLRYEERIDLDLDDIVKRQFIGWMLEHSSERKEETDGQYTETAQVEAVSTGDQPESAASIPTDTLLEAEEASQG